jgi:hypothetical protein
VELKKFSKEKKKKRKKEKKKPSSRIQRHKDSRIQGLEHSKQKKRHQYLRTKANIRKETERGQSRAAFIYNDY